MGEGCGQHGDGSPAWPCAPQCWGQDTTVAHAASGCGWTGDGTGQTLGRRAQEPGCPGNTGGGRGWTRGGGGQNPAVTRHAVRSPHPVPRCPPSPRHRRAPTHTRAHGHAQTRRGQVGRGVWAPSAAPTLSCVQALGSPPRGGGMTPGRSRSASVLRRADGRLLFGKPSSFILVTPGS